MADWNYANTINSLALSTVATFSTVEDEVPSSFVDGGLQTPGRDGVLFDAEASFAPLVFSLRVHLRWTGSDGTVTHMDGAAGHIYQNLSLLKRELNKTAPVFTRTLPHIGAVRSVVKSVTPGLVGEQRHVYVFPLTAPEGSWQTATEASSTGSPPTGVITTGDRRIHDPRISLSAAGTYTVTDAGGIVYTIVATSGPTYPIVVNVGARTIIDNAAADASGYVTFSHEEWLRLSPNHTHVVAGACTVYWRNRWA
jgi:hypothetical protein